MVKAVCTSCVLWLPHSPVSEQPVWIAHILQKTGDLTVNQLGHLNEWRSENYKPGLQQVEKKKKKKARASWFPNGVLLSLRTGPRSKRKLLLLWRIQVTSQRSLSSMACLSGSELRLEESHPFTFPSRLFFSFTRLIRRSRHLPTSINL